MADLSAHMRVNHAGEAGAVQIYRAQQRIARWSAPELLATLARFEQEERHHLALFDHQRQRLGEPVCATRRLCEVGGWTLGAFSALCGREGVAGCTEGVETVVLEHLRSQRALCVEIGDLEALACLEKVIAEEETHRDTVFAPHVRSHRYQLVRGLSAFLTRRVISLGLSA